jgi:hypothetical protein
VKTKLLSQEIGKRSGGSKYNGELKLRMPFPKLLSGEDISIKLYFKNIESIAASEGSYVSSEANFKQTIMDLNAREGAERSKLI